MKYIKGDKKVQFSPISSLNVAIVLESSTGSFIFLQTGHTSCLDFPLGLLINYSNLKLIRKWEKKLLLRYHIS